ncbi:MAG: glutamate--tRNA ligase [Acidimicrobiia bacterium]
MRARFAPSPTGFLHIGNARTALFNWLAVRNAGGEFIVRSDDTDTARSTPEFAQDILDGLRWLGLDWDEGIEVGGPHGSYRQSDRFDRYREVAASLTAAAKAYPCFCTAEELDERRQQARDEGKPPGYDGRCRKIDPEEASSRVAAGESASLRLAVPRPGATTFRDVVREDMSFDHETIDDFVILRSDGSPTYHLASSVDDIDYGITHVIRGEDLLSSTPRHILIAQGMGAEPPTYVHLSLLMGPDGSKLSKRHGDTSLHAYRNAGFVDGAVVNYLSLLGWSPGGDDDIVSRDDAVARFSLDDVLKNPAVFDPQKLEWMNGAYIRAMDPEGFAASLQPLVEADLERPLEAAEMAALTQLAPLVQERTKLLTEVAPQVRFLFGDPVYDDKSWDKVMTTPEALVALGGASTTLEGVGDWNTAAIEEALRAMLESVELSPRKGLQPIRVAVTGSSVSPPLFESLEALGKDKSLTRIRVASERIG